MDVNPLDPTGIRDSTKGYSTPVRLKHDQYGKFLLFVMGKKQMFSGNLSSSTKKWVTEPFIFGPHIPTRDTSLQGSPRLFRKLTPAAPQ